MGGRSGQSNICLVISKHRLYAPHPQSNVRFMFVCLHVWLLSESLTFRFIKVRCLNMPYIHDIVCLFLGSSILTKQTLLVTLIPVIPDAAARGRGVSQTHLLIHSFFLRKLRHFLVSTQGKTHGLDNLIFYYSKAFILVSVDN